jgi:hypothetical protein
MCDKNYFLKYFLFENILKYFFIFYNLFLISSYQNDLNIYKKLKQKNIKILKNINGQRCRTCLQ